MAKISVYVPDDLLQQVRAEEIAVSWVCQQALLASVQNRTAARAASEDLHVVARRLRQGQFDQQAADEREGFAFGVAWARESATLDELERVDRAVRRARSISYARVPTLTARILDSFPDAEFEADDELDGEGAAFDRGLLAGAAEVYRNVRPLIEASLEEAPRRGRRPAATPGPGSKLTTGSRAGRKATS